MAMTNILRRSTPLVAYLSALAVGFAVIVVTASHTSTSVDGVTIIVPSTHPAHASAGVHRNDLGNLLLECRAPTDLIVLAALVGEGQELGKMQHAFRCGDPSQSPKGAIVQEQCVDMTERVPADVLVAMDMQELLHLQASLCPSQEAVGPNGSSD